MLLASISLLVLLLAYSYFFVPSQDVRLLPIYALISLGRITVVFFIALLSGVGLGVLAALNRSLGGVIIPLFDILQSVPILGYFPILLVAIMAAFPGYWGRELAVWALLYTAMEWSIFFGVVGSIKAIPSSVREASAAFNIKGYAYFRNVLLPAMMPAIISASTLAWNDGWAFDIAAEFVSYNGQNYSVPGIGSFIAAKSLVETDLAAAWMGLLVIGGMVVLTNQVIWHRLADKIAQHKPLLSLHVPERLVHPLRAMRMPARRIFVLRFRVEMLGLLRFRHSFSTRLVATAFLLGLVAIGVASNLSTILPAFSLISQMVEGVSIPETLVSTLFTLGRLFAAYMAALLLSLLAAHIASQNRGFTRAFYSVYDVGRSIPYLALFPPLFATLAQALPGELGLEISSFILLFMAMIWYIIYNVVTAASYLPEELREVSLLFGFRGLRRLRDILIPSILPAIVTGSVLAWGGGWNVVIYSEYVTQAGRVYSLPGLGSLLGEAASQGRADLVAFHLFIMSGIVILIGRLVWRRLLERVERRGVELT